MNTKNTIITVLTLLCMTTAVYAQSAKAEDAAKSKGFMGGPEMKGTESYFAKHPNLFPKEAKAQEKNNREQYKEERYWNRWYAKKQRAEEKAAKALQRQAYYENSNFGSKYSPEYPFLSPITVEFIKASDPKAKAKAPAPKKESAVRFKGSKTSAPFLDAQAPSSVIGALRKYKEGRKSLSAVEKELNDALGVKESFSSKICKDCGYENAPFFAVLGKYFEEHKKAKAEGKKAPKGTSSVSPKAKAFFDALLANFKYKEIASVIIAQDCSAKPVRVACGGKSYTYDAKVTPADIDYVIKSVKSNIIIHSNGLDIIYNAVVAVYPKGSAPYTAAIDLKRYPETRGVFVR